MSQKNHRNGSAELETVSNSKLYLICTKIGKLVEFYNDYNNFTQCVFIEIIFIEINNIFTISRKL